MNQEKIGKFSSELRKEYDFLSEMYWEGCQDLFTEEDYDNFGGGDISV